MVSGELSRLDLNQLRFAADRFLDALGEPFEATVQHVIGSGDLGDIGGLGIVNGWVLYVAFRGLPLGLRRWPDVYHRIAFSAAPDDSKYLFQYLQALADTDSTGQTRHCMPTTRVVRRSQERSGRDAQG